VAIKATAAAAPDEGVKHKQPHAIAVLKPEEEGTKAAFPVCGECNGCGVDWKAASKAGPGRYYVPRHRPPSRILHPRSMS
jgi:hypothetical protein